MASERRRSLILAEEEIGPIYLYNEGDECIDVTGGWTGYRREVNSVYEYSDAITKDYSSFTINNSETWGYTADNYFFAITNNTINLSRYSKLHVVFSLSGISGTQNNLELVTSQQVNISNPSVRDIDVSMASSEGDHHYIYSLNNYSGGYIALISYRCANTITKIWVE